MDIGLYIHIRACYSNYAFSRIQMSRTEDLLTSKRTHQLALWVTQRSNELLKNTTLQPSQIVTSISYLEPIA